jgi:hypothetical protein
VYELWNINCKSERNVYITLRLAVYISQLIHYAQTYSLYFTTHTSRSGLQFIFHNSHITLRLTVCISQLIHVMYELWNINCKPERDVWVVKYKLHALAWCMSCELKHYVQAYSLYFTTHTLRSGLQFIFHNSYITLRYTVYNSQLIASLSVRYELWNINCKPERDVWVMIYKL